MKSELITLLQNAHAGERAAAFAYNGHWRSVDGDERLEIQKIENEEWEHRACLLQMLTELGARPRLPREILMVCVGAVIFVLCRVGGWLNVGNLGWYISMYGAGKLELGNIAEYEVAARYAKLSGNDQFVEGLLHMANVEWEHENYFRAKCLGSKWSGVLKVWPGPSPRILQHNGPGLPT